MADDIVQRLRINADAIDWEQPLAAERQREAAAEIERLRAEVDRFRAELIRAAEAVGAQTFDVKAISKGRRKQLVKLSQELLMVADGDRPIRLYHERTITTGMVKDRFPELQTKDF